MTVFLFPLIALGLVVLLAAVTLAIRSRRRISALPPLPTGQKATPGAQRQIDTLRDQINHALQAAVVAVVLIGIGFAATGWQIDNAFDALEEERVERIGGQSSINAYFCRKIDDVGKGVAALVTVSLEQSPPPTELSPAERKAYEKFANYAEKEERPPRCRQVALQLAILTGADPEDVEITPLSLGASAAKKP